jgi:hypothetical protein
VSPDSAPRRTLKACSARDFLVVISGLSFPSSGIHGGRKLAISKRRDFRVMGSQDLERVRLEKLERAGDGEIEPLPSL